MRQVLFEMIFVASNYIPGGEEQDVSTTMLADTTQKPQHVNKSIWHIILNAQMGRTGFDMGMNILLRIAWLNTYTVHMAGESI